MKTTITGTIKQDANQGPEIGQNLNVKIYEKKLTSKTKPSTVTLGDDGVFKWEVEHKTKPDYTILLELCFKPEEGEETIVATSGPHCAGKDIEVQFDFNLKDHVVWFDHIEQAVKPHIGRKKPSNKTIKT